MYKKQKGVLPFMLYIFGSVLILYSFLIFFYVIALPIWRGSQFNVLEQVTTFFSTSIPLFVFGFLLINMFPQIKLSQDGIRYRGFLFYGLVKWGEIENLIELKNKIIALTVNRKGFLFFNGLLLYRLYGYVFGLEYPAMLLVLGLEYREQMLAEIMKNSLTKKLGKVSDLSL